jgi:hypothetical protein
MTEDFEMAARPPEGLKADFTQEQASEAYMPRPPSARELDRLSEAQSLITDEWTGEPPAKSPGTEPEKPAPGPGGKA